MKKLFNLIISTITLLGLLVFICLLTSCQSTPTASAENVKNQTTTTTENSDLIFDWTEVNSIYTGDYLNPGIKYATTEQEITKNEYEELRSTGTSANLPNYINQFESKQDAISKYENEIGHYYFNSDNNYKYYKFTITGYELTTYEVRLYKSNYIEIKTIVYNSSDNSITSSITGTFPFNRSISIKF